MTKSSSRNILTDPETRGFVLGTFSSITSSIIALYIVQRYLIQRAADEAAKRTITDYKREFGIMSPKWEPLSGNTIKKIVNITNNP